MANIWVFTCKRCYYRFEVQGIVKKNDWVCPMCGHRHKKAVETLEQTAMYGKEKVK